MKDWKSVIIEILLMVLPSCCVIPGLVYVTNNLLTDRYTNQPKSTTHLLNFVFIWGLLTLIWFEYTIILHAQGSIMPRYQIVLSSVIRKCVAFLDRKWKRRAEHWKHWMIRGCTSVTGLPISGKLWPRNYDIVKGDLQTIFRFSYLKVYKLITLGTKFKGEVQ